MTIDVKQKIEKKRIRNEELLTLNYFRRRHYNASDVIEKYLCQRLPYED